MSLSLSPRLENGDFRLGVPGSQPVAWTLSPGASRQGYGFRLEAAASSGRACGVLSRQGQSGNRSPVGTSASCIQSLAADRFRGRRFHLKANALLEPQDSADRAYLWVRINRPRSFDCRFEELEIGATARDGFPGLEIRGEVPHDAHSIVVGMTLIGSGEAFLGKTRLRLDRSKQWTSPRAQRANCRAGLVQTIVTGKLLAERDQPATQLRIPLPYALDSQAPLCFELGVNAGSFSAARWSRGREANCSLDLSLNPMRKGTAVEFGYRALLLAGKGAQPAPAEPASLPAGWPGLAQQWLPPETPGIPSSGESPPRCPWFEEPLPDDFGCDLTSSLEAIERAKLLAQAMAEHARETGFEENFTEAPRGLAMALAQALDREGIPARIQLGSAGVPRFPGPSGQTVKALVPGLGSRWVYPGKALVPCPNPWTPIPPAFERTRTPRFSGLPIVPVCVEPSRVQAPLGRGLHLKLQQASELLRPLHGGGEGLRPVQRWARKRWWSLLKSDPIANEGIFELGVPASLVQARTLGELRREFS